MHWSGWLIYAVVVLWALPAGVKSWTALALAVAWGAAEVFCWKTGMKIPVRLYVLLDVMVILSVMNVARGRDWIALAIFPLMFCVYVADPPAYEQWWMLWALAMVQFLVVGRWSHIVLLRSNLNELVRCAFAVRPFARNHPAAVQSDLHAAEQELYSPGHLEHGPDQALAGKDR